MKSGGEKLERRHQRIFGDGRSHRDDTLVQTVGVIVTPAPGVVNAAYGSRVGVGAGGDAAGAAGTKPLQHVHLRAREDGKAGKAAQQLGGVVPVTGAVLQAGDHAGELL